MGISEKNSGYFHSQVYQRIPPQFPEHNLSGVPGRTPLMEQAHIWFIHTVRRPRGRLGAPATVSHHNGEKFYRQLSILCPGGRFHHAGCPDRPCLDPNQGYRANIQ